MFELICAVVKQLSFEFIRIFCFDRKDSKHFSHDMAEIRDDSSIKSTISFVRFVGSFSVSSFHSIFIVFEAYSCEDAIDHAGIGRGTVSQIVLCGLHWSTDAMEVMIMTYLAPAVKLEFDLDPSSEGVLGSIVLFGIAIGVFVIG
jgi:hypothetical protein